MDVASNFICLVLRLWKLVKIPEKQTTDKVSFYDMGSLDVVIQLFVWSRKLSLLIVRAKRGLRLGVIPASVRPKGVLPPESWNRRNDQYI
ncbi:uncharacterized protein CIMG_07046 [Coccidioides immitis RS]|uniref:Uncharacterized protein n=1 Tax=Coccidioides immitis (strain RS) TaxID=246410 RepID=J3K9I3_COCIM|nr:uncharacterized protein CIMG_07046 [Coccidioides immitis RS]EAS31567.3 hypothetical protein CIMG_07046 [Coccidioides immitis RS]